MTQKAAAKKVEAATEVAVTKELEAATEVATMTAQSTALAVPSIDISEDAGNGFTSKDLTIPFLRILQALSPQVQKRGPAYVNGAEAGMFFNTATGQLWDGEGGVLFVPACYERRITQWKPRAAGGGLVKDHGKDESILAHTQRNDAGRDVLPNGDEVVAAGMYYGFVLDGETFIPGVLSLSGTQFKKARKWNNVIDALRVPHPQNPSARFNPAMFYSVFRLTTVQESNDKGSWFGLSVARHADTLSLPGGSEVYLAARDLRRSVNEGATRAAVETPEGEAVAAGDDIPF